MKPRHKNTEEPKKAANILEKNKTVTHLFYNDKNISAINNLKGYSRLTVLYLHNNNINKIEHLQHLCHLRSLYLQCNKIKKIEGLNLLINLQKLYLGHNEISVVENLEALCQLEELHIDKQHFGSGDKLCFDPRSIKSLGNSLKVLNISGNNISSLQVCGCLQHLQILNSSNNCIQALSDVINVVEKLPYLREANFFGNPVGKEHRYRETIIAKSNSLKTLDGKDITDVTRSFMKKFEFERSNFETAHIELPKSIIGISRNYPFPFQKAVSSFMLKPVKAVDDTTLPLRSDAYIPWKCITSSSNKAIGRVHTSFRQQKGRKELRKNLPSLPNLFL